jgi:hypothetical protein
LISNLTEEGTESRFLHIHNLDIEDKHRGLLTTTHLADITGIRVRLDDGREVEISNWRLVKDRVPGHCITGNRNVEIANYGNATLDIQFGQGLPYEGNAVVPTCLQLAQLVLGIVTELARITGVWMEYRVVS